MAVPSHGSWEDWSAALDRVLNGSSMISDEPCPSCGAKDLHIAFTGDVTTMLGYASFWCGTSMDGIFTSRLHLPTGVEIIPLGLPPEDRRRIVPNFYVIPPSSSNGDTESIVL